MRKIIGIILCLIIIFSAVDVCFAGTYLGGNKNGWAEKEVYGNQASSNTIVIITGVHPREYGFHNAMREALQSQSKTLNKKYVLYIVHVTKNPWNYNVGRMNGQVIANKFVVPDVKKVKPKIVFDIHENMWKSSGYKYPRFMDPISKTWATRNYAYNIASRLGLKVYDPKGTSPKYVTKPISKFGIPTLVYETYKMDSYSKKVQDANKFLYVVERV